MPLFGRRKPGFGREYLTEDPQEGQVQEPAPACVGDILAGFIRQNSGCGVLVGVKELLAQDEAMPRYMREMAGSPACGDIATIEGIQDTYYYSVNEMSDFFAMITMLTREGNYPRMIAEMVRYNCRVYPASTPDPFDPGRQRDALSVFQRLLYPGIRAGSGGQHGGNINHETVFQKQTRRGKA